MLSFFARRHFLNVLRVPCLLNVKLTSTQPPAMCAPYSHTFSQLTRHGPVVFWASHRAQRFHCSPQRPEQKRRKTEPAQPHELDLLRYDMGELKKSPKPALYLGCAGLIPFVSAPLLMGVMEAYYPDVAYAQMAYGASIISFLGGARWGFALPEGSPAKPDWMNLSNSVVPSLLAWVALLFRDSIVEAALVVIMGLGVSLHNDLSLLPTYPSWFKALRTILTVVATFSLVATLLLKGFYPEKKLLKSDS